MSVFVEAWPRHATETVRGKGRGGRSSLGVPKFSQGIVMGIPIPWTLYVYACTDPGSDTFESCYGEKGVPMV